MKRTLKLAFLSLFVIANTISLSFAAEPTSTITISPFLREVRFSADEATKDFSVEITNYTAQAQSFNLSVLDFGSLDDSGGVVFAGSDSSTLVKKYGLTTWLHLANNSLTLAPNETAEIKATIVNDSSMAPGGHYAAIIASVEGSNTNPTNEIDIKQQLSSLILATKVGGEQYDLKLNSISSDGNLLTLPKEVSLMFNNPGNVHVVPRGTVKLLSISGQLVASGVINQESGYVFPETSRVIAVELDTVSGTSFWPNAYHLQVDYRYEGMDQFARKEQLVHYVNVQSLALFIVFIVTIVGLFRRTIKHKKIRQKRQKRN